MTKRKAEMLFTIDDTVYALMPRTDGWGRYDVYAIGRFICHVYYSGYDRWGLRDVAERSILQAIGVEATRAQADMI